MRGEHIQGVGGYASRSRDGIHDLLEIETARATIDTISDLHADLQDGIGISGPAARCAIIAATTAPHFAGTTITARNARKSSPIPAWPSTTTRTPC